MKTGKLLDEIAGQLAAQGYELTKSTVESYEGSGGAVHFYFRKKKEPAPAFQVGAP